MKNNKILLGVNIDHVATLRQARFTRYPDPIEAVFAAENGGADLITVHLREDRRHIQERDLKLIMEVKQTRLNLEMAVTDAMIKIADDLRPEECCFVPEKREELTTEGGLDVIANGKRILDAVSQLTGKGIDVSLFIDPDQAQIEAAAKTGAAMIEIHTGCYADATSPIEMKKQLERIILAVEYAKTLGLIVNAGHGLNYQNVTAIAQIADIYTLNIGHAIIAKSIFIGLEAAVREMRQLMFKSKMF